MAAWVRSLLVSVVCGAVLVAEQPAVPQYDPLAVRAEARPAPRDLVVSDEARGRNIPVLVYMPSGSTAAPVVLFSHGLGGSRTGSAYLGRHWAARGYVAVFLQHPGSDESVWRDVPQAKRMAALQRAANAQNFLLRVQDVKATLDELTRWNADNTHAWHGRLDLQRVGMSGHSFGAVTTQAVSGQGGIGPVNRLTDTRIKAAVVMSPSVPANVSPAAAFGKVSLPWLLMTGTRDQSVIGNTTVESRLRVFPALPPGGKYELVLFDGLHSAFTESDLPGDRGARNPNHHKAILAISTAFWDAWLRADPEARVWLDGAGPRKVLESRDRWTGK